MYSSHWLQGVSYKFRSCEFWTFDEWNRQHIWLLLFNWNKENGKAVCLNLTLLFPFSSVLNIATLLSLEEINTKTFCYVFQFSFQSCSNCFSDIYLLKIMIFLWLLCISLFHSPAGISYYCNVRNFSKRSLQKQRNTRKHTLGWTLDAVIL